MFEKLSKISEQPPKQEIFDGKFEFYYGGIEQGSFKPTEPNFYEKLNAVRKKLGLKYVFAPSLSFTRRTASATDENERGYVVGENGKKEKYADEGILRTVSKADGGIIFLDDLKEAGIEPNEIALAGFNADCPFIIGYESEKKAFFMLHAGLGCLHKTGDENNQTIFEQMVRKYKLDPKKIKIQVSAGIQKCCYGRNDGKVFPDILKSWGLRFGDIASTGDRQGQPSLNLSALILNALQRSGVNSANIEIDSSCTCCDGKHFSNVKGDSERNLLLVRPQSTVEN